jgi:protein-disulfide isomerase
MGFRVIRNSALFFLMIGTAVWFNHPNLKSTGNNQKNYSSLIAFADEKTETTITEMILGSDDAKIEIVEYASYTCPHCATFHTEIYPRLKNDYIETGKVRFIYREVYFDKFGLWASMIARCAGPEKFFGLTELIYKSQQKWARAGDDAAIVTELSKVAKVAGLNDQKIQNCLEDTDKLRALVEWFKNNASNDDIKSTPSFIIDGEKFSNMGYDDFSSIIDSKISE